MAQKSIPSEKNKYVAESCRKCGYITRTPRELAELHRRDLCKKCESKG